MPAHPGARRPADRPAAPPAAHLAAAGRRAGLAAAALLLAAACVAIHAQALRSGWKFDDPALLRYALEYGAWQTFTSRDAMLALTYANIAPWNAFFYQLGLPWFGLAPAGHYAHMLAVVAATAVATWWLVARHAGRRAAWVAAGLYLASAPTAAVSLSLMTGHYAYGLLFTVLALGSFAIAVERGSARHAWAAAAWYALACLCKELYVPLAVALLFWPVAMPWSRRLRLAAPSLAVAAAYAALRLWLLGGIGGYAWLTEDGAAARRPAAAALRDLGEALVPLVFGGGRWGAAAALLLSLALLAAAAAAWRHRRIGAAGVGFVAVSALLMLAPVAPMFLYVFPHGPERLGYLIAWATAVAAGWSARSGAAGAVLATLAVASMLVAQRGVIARFDRPEPASTQYDFVVRSGPGDVLVPHGYADLGYLQSMAEAAAIVNRRPAAQIVRDDEELAALGPARGRAAWAWHDGCACLRRLGTAYDERTARFAAAVRAGAGRDAAIRLELLDRGPRKLVRWRIDGPPGRARLDVHEAGAFELTRPAGGVAFGVDSTTRVPAGVVHLRFTIEAAGGALIRSPLLVLPLAPSNTLHWRSAR